MKRRGSAQKLRDITEHDPWLWKVRDISDEEFEVIAHGVRVGLRKSDPWERVDSIPKELSQER